MFEQNVEEIKPMTHHWQWNSDEMCLGQERERERGKDKKSLEKSENLEKNLRQGQLHRRRRREIIISFHSRSDLDILNNLINSYIQF